MVLGSHTGSQTLPGQAGLWSLSLAVPLGVRQPALTKTRNTDPYCWPVQNSAWLRPSARLSVSLAFYLFMGLFYVGRDVQEAFRSRVEPRLFIYFFWNWRNHIYFLPLVFTAKVRQRSRSLAYRNSTLVPVQICTYFRLLPEVRDSREWLVWPPQVPQPPRTITQSGRARFLQIAWNGGTYVRNALCSQI